MLLVYRYHTDKTVRFVVSMTPDKLRAAEMTKGLHSFFKLQTTISTANMVLFDQNGCMKRYDLNILTMSISRKKEFTFFIHFRYEDETEILREFYDLRLVYYGKRKKYLEGMLEAEALKLSNQARFILEKCDGSLKVENKKKKVMIAELQRKNFDPDPVKKWKNDQAKLQAAGMDALDEPEDSDSDLDEDAKDAGKTCDKCILISRIFEYWNKSNYNDSRLRLPHGHGHVVFNSRTQRGLAQTKG